MVRPHLPMNAFRVLSVMTACLGMGMLAVAHAEPPPTFPTDPNAWINAGPLSISGLKGKGIVLWFFEEDDANTRARWPAMMEATKKFKDQPIVFIAVNSGNPRAKTEAYFRQLQVKVTWPVLVDMSRDFEKACGLFQEVNAQNVSVFRYIKPEGEMQTGLVDDIEELADKAVEGATWKIDPSTIPDSLKPVWMAVEVGNYKGIASTLKKSASSSKADVKDATAKLMELVQKDIDELSAKIKEAQDGSNPYRAFELLTELNDHFNGFELPKDVATLKKDLAKDAKVKAGQFATKALDLARKQMSAGNAGLKTKSEAALKKIIEEYPDTNLAKQAKAILDYAP